ncbi:MAG: hypothetical protein L6R42_008305 [Xanthoria sp. 1 TBL-2021]|nr:MAG: hypothetical protein L6R42_008305 [Xanthoria sp. 1 TBL-2021]
MIKVREKVRDLPPLKDLEYNTLYHPPRSNFSAADFVIWNEASQKYFGISTTTTPELDISPSLMDVVQKGETQAQDYIHVFVKDLRHSEDEMKNICLCLVRRSIGQKGSLSKSVQHG